MSVSFLNQFRLSIWSEVSLWLQCLLAEALIKNQSHPLYRPHTIEEPMPKQGRKSKKLQEVIPSLKSEWNYSASSALHFLCKAIPFPSTFATVNTLLVN